MSHAGLQLLGGLPSCRYTYGVKRTYLLFRVFLVAYLSLSCRLLTCPRTSRSSCCASKPRQSVRIAAKRGHIESDWEKEFSPGNRLAKRSQLEFEQIQSSPSSSSLDSNSFDINGSFDGGEVDCEFNGSQAPANQSIMHRLFGRHWEELPAKYKLVFATSMAFVLCNMDKVNISVAIIPMAEDFGWSSTVSGLVQSSFFFGYMLSQIPGGYIIAKKGGRKVLPLGVGLWSLATAAVPVMAGTMPGMTDCTHKSTHCLLGRVGARICLLVLVSHGYKQYVAPFCMCGKAHKLTGLGVMLLLLALNGGQDVEVGTPLLSPVASCLLCCRALCVQGRCRFGRGCGPLVSH